MLGSNKTVYHSALVQATKKGAIKILITCDGPRQSNYKGQPDYVTFKYEGEDKNYPVENDDCAEAMTGWKGETVWVTATGSRDEARIEVEAEQGGRSEPERREERRAAREEREPRREERHEDRRERSAPPRLTAEQKAAQERVNFDKMKVLGARIAVAMKASLIHARRIADDVFGDGIATVEDIRAIGLCHFIELKGSTDLGGLPTKWLEPLQRESAPPREREPEQQREPEPERRERQREEPAADRGSRRKPVDPDEDHEQDDIPF